MSARVQNWLRGAGLALLALLCFWNLGAGVLNETDEGFAANRAASFFRHDTGLVSFDDVNSDEPQFRKPPLLYWAVAACLKTLGWNLWSVRLPVALAGFGSCLLLYLLFRRALGEVVTGCAVLAYAALPFVLWHIRTAMLEMPLLFLVLLSLWLHLHQSHRWWAPVAAGLVAGSALLLKGGAGLLAPGLLLLCGPALIRPWRRGLGHTALALAVAVLPLALYVIALPPEWRDGFIQGGAVREGAARISRASLGERLDVFIGPMLKNLRWHLPAAGAGLVVLLVGLARNRAWRGWLWIALAVTVPVILLGVKQVVPYARYFLPAYPFLVALSVLFCWQCVERRWASFLLLPLAIGSALLENGGALRWIPAAAALVVLIPAATGVLARVGPAARHTVAALLCLAISGPSILSARVVGQKPYENEAPMPPVARLAALANERMPPGEKLVVGTGFKLHGVLFYSRRAVITFPWWLVHEFTPGRARYGLFPDPPFDAVPGLKVETVAQEAHWHLVRLEVGAAPETPMAALWLKEAERAEAGAALDFLQVGWRSFAHGLLVTSVVDRAEVPVELHCVTLVSTQENPACITLVPEPGTEWKLDRPRRVSGLDLFPVKRQEVVQHFRVEVPDPAAAGGWRGVAAVAEQPAGEWDRRAGRVVQAHPRAVRVRFDPVVTDRLRVVKTGPPRSRLAALAVWETPAGSEQTP